ncbi:hypothetical protein P9G84_21440 [Brevibacillus centrosporus]|uniref:hypothetical protein n=1 Tax=Brevibacillus centrosporus TaxID=54910 RepID=UPI000F09AD8F|nr:hypothetical protein [Brevibacillus centrosporus]MEC2131489.1 hypothetical protein [Brevibacillus centrosporus]RNB72485.1 hypothetical protein EDM55_04580 [Brevibacillus centrosporus]GED31075.1 hypothetical protein BCE02nite_22160 [Brevibacillus centrosporus]
MSGADQLDIDGELAGGTREPIYAKEPGSFFFKTKSHLTKKIRPDGFLSYYLSMICAVTIAWPTS